MFKDKTDDGFKITYTNAKVAKEKLLELHIDTTTNKTITAWDVYDKNPKLFSYSYLSFYHEDPNVFSFFRGYDFKGVPEVDMKIIQPWLDHVRYIIMEIGKPMNM
jgi:hypothetical protein